MALKFYPSNILLRFVLLFKTTRQKAIKLQKQNHVSSCWSPTLLVQFLANASMNQLLCDPEESNWWEVWRGKIIPSSKGNSGISARASMWDMQDGLRTWTPDQTNKQYCIMNYPILLVLQIFLVFTFVLVFRFLGFFIRLVASPKPINMGCWCTFQKQWKAENEVQNELRYD